MKRNIMSERIAALTLGLGLTACYSGGSATDDDFPGEGTGSWGDDGDAEGGHNDGEGGVDEPEPQTRCEESKIGPPLLRRLTQNEFETTIRAVFPEIDASFGGVALGVDTVSSLGFGNDASVLLVSEQSAREILTTAEDVATLVTAPETLGQLLPCSTTAPDFGCASTFIDDYGQRLFRRPLRAAEREHYGELFAAIEQRSSFATGLKWSLVAMLESPHLVYRSELGEPTGDGERRLAGWELATALAYNFSGGPPNADLRALGEAGALEDPDTRVEQARTLLASAGGRLTLDRFFEDWLDYRLVTTQSRANAPQFESVRDAMAEETRRFIESVVVDDEGGVDSLLLSDYTALNAALSAYYSFGNISGEFELVPRPPEWGVGLLAQGSIVAANANIDASSPTQRGLLVFERLLCLPPPPVPADIPPIEAPSPGVTTTRERYEAQHTANDGCNSCHTLFDPIGFAFEHFDAAGRYRADEAGLTIDASGRLPKSFDGGEVTFDGLRELSERLADRPEVTDCVGGLMASYVFGGAGGTVCLAEEARTELEHRTIGIAEYIAQLAAAPHFSRRSTEDSE